MTRHDKCPTPAEARVRLEQLPVMLRAERARLGLPQRAAAKEMRVSSGTVANIESGRVPDVFTFLAMATWLRIPPHWFIGEPGDDHSAADAYARGWADHAALTEAAVADMRAALAKVETAPPLKWEDAT